MQSVFAKLLYEMEKENDTVLVTLIKSSGSTPRGTGSQMLVAPYGLAAGSIGGGAVELRSIEMAQELICSRSSTVHEFHLNTNKVEDLGMVCGGDTTAHFQFIPADSELWSQLAKQVMRCFSEKIPATLVLQLSGEPAALMGDDGALLAGIKPAESAAVKALPLQLTNRALIFGAGHIAERLVPLLKTIDFAPVVFDCRPEFATEARFPDAASVICGDFDRISSYLTFQPDDYVVIMTQGHSSDLSVENQVLRCETAYIGVIGSAKKTAAVNAKLRALGIPEEALSRIYTPVGTKIKAVTPAEIAVSIAGEMILVRALRREGNAEVHHGCPMK